MFSERRGAARTPRPEPEWLGAALTQEIAPLRLEVCCTSILLLPRAPNPGSHHSSRSIHPAFVPMAPPVACMCVCMHMYARLLTRVSHRCPPRRRLPSRGDAWAPPVNSAAFICPDEWRAALSVPLPAISSGSLEPHRFARPLSPSLSSLLPVHTHTPCTPHQMTLD